MKKSLTVRLHPELIDAVRSCAAREHRTLTNFIEASLLTRIGDVEAKALFPARHLPLVSEGPTRGE